MQKIKSQSIIYNFDLNKQEPLDPRIKIETITDLPVIEKRYQGLIFFVKDQNKPYIFLNDLTTPIALSDLINSNNIFGIISSDYSTLIATLNSFEPTLGNLITIYPLGITVIFDGEFWKYYSGDYTILDGAQFNSIPNELKNINSLVIIEETRYIIKSDLTLSTEVIVLTEMPPTFDNNRYYKINSNLYFAINGIFYNIGNKTKVIENYTLINGLNVIEHNFESSYISVLFWINNLNKVIRLTEYKKINNNNIELESYTEITGTLILSTIY